MNKVYITVEAKPGYGKSTVAEIISKALSDHGINNQVNHLNNEVDRKLFLSTIDKKISTLKQRDTVVEINERSQKLGVI